MLNDAPENLIIRVATTDEIVDLRHEILRSGLPRGLAYFEGDDEPTTRHVACEIDRTIVGCVTILRRPWNDRPAWQLRGMAIANPFQGHGIGTLLLQEIERLVRCSAHSHQLWCNARVPASQFYLKHGWEIASPEFSIEHAGPHVKMTKCLAD